MKQHQKAHVIVTADFSEIKSEIDEAIVVSNTTATNTIIENNNSAAEELTAIGLKYQPITSS